MQVVERMLKKRIAGRKTFVGLKGLQIDCADSRCRPRIVATRGFNQDAGRRRVPGRQKEADGSGDRERSCASNRHQSPAAPQVTREFQSFQRVTHLVVKSERLS